MIHAIEALSGRPFPKAVWRAAGKDQRGRNQAAPALRPEKDRKEEKGGRDKGSDEEEELDEGLKGSFPASDPVSVTTPTRPGRPHRG
jgi:hypothetical protein